VDSDADPSLSLLSAVAAEESAAYGRRCAASSFLVHHLLSGTREGEERGEDAFVGRGAGGASTFLPPRSLGEEREERRRQRRLCGLPPIFHQLFMVKFRGGERKGKNERTRSFLILLAFIFRPGREGKKKGKKGRDGRGKTIVDRRLAFSVFFLCSKRGEGGREERRGGRPRKEEEVTLRDQEKREGGRGK